MGLKITELGVTVAGKVTRKYDQGANQTTLVFTEDQVHEMHEAVALAVDIFDEQAKR